MQSIKSTPMGMVFANTTSGTYVEWCRDTWHGHGDAADMHSVFRHYQAKPHVARECFFCMNSVVAVVLRSWSWRYACHASSVFHQW